MTSPLSVTMIYKAKHESEIDNNESRLDKIAKIACGYIFECRDEQTVGPGLNYVHESELIIESLYLRHVIRKCRSFAHNTNH